ncbi:crotonase/enoyl-CoA hydratase family protein [Pseudomaricurvus alkylphenolicus]|uniref:crotonase/enoyl-CoA hydratase family protein n=1 Tax=Pseudomaricurvus alkylphenolicus TaxID=1306991 RepID=UPI001420E722|nr:crotonase/enoyl-CoA hydratase family protein [Pseudomaricurvus alkylphenolicus]NIB42426.1 crotonase/enoyl-CoA hydratase family protein [Pseudomaricurvus alkylphenolicus]
MNTHQFQNIQYSVENAIATITLARPEKMNALTGEMLEELVQAFDLVDADDDVRAVVVTGAGKAFCAGADLAPEDGNNPFASETIPRNPDGSVNYNHASVRDFGGLVTLRIFDCLKPVIGAINGAAVGFGASMIVAMDMRLASEHSKYGYLFARRGIVPESACSWFLPQIVGRAQALEWCMTGRIFGADEALRGGLVRSIHAPDQLLDAAYELAREIADNTAPVSVALTRHMLWRVPTADHPMEGHQIDSRGIFSRSKSADAREGIASFLEKRPAQYPDKVSSDMPDFFPWWQPRGYERD